MNNNIDIQQYQNLLVMLKITLEFYGNESHYKSDITRGLSIMMIDEGHQARYALDLIEKLEYQYMDAEKELLDIMGEEMNQIYTPLAAEELFNIIKTIKKDE